MVLAVGRVGSLVVLVVGCVGAVSVSLALAAFPGSASGASWVGRSWSQAAGGRVGELAAGSAGVDRLLGDPFVARAQLTALGPVDGFGASVAEQGSLVVVGAPTTNVGGSAEEGAVYVFSRPAGGWSGGIHEVARLVASGSPAAVRLGSSVAIFGRTIVAGASSVRRGSRVGPGAVYVFVEPKRGWSGTIRSIARLTASDGAAADGFGGSVAVSGDTVVAGAPDSGTGGVYVFTRPAQGWSGTLHQARKLTVPGLTADDGLGSSVAVSGATVVAGARGGAPGAYCSYAYGGASAVYVFVRPPAGWSRTLGASAQLALGGIGVNVAIAGHTIVASTQVCDKYMPDSPASVDVFNEPAGGWAGDLGPNAELTTNPLVASAVGRSLAISGRTVAVGALGGSGDGLVLMFTEPTGGWSGTVSDYATLTASQSVAWTGPRLGDAVALSGDTVVASFGPLSDGSGAAYVYTMPSSGWASEQQQAELTAAHSVGNQSFGHVALTGQAAFALGEDSRGSYVLVFDKPQRGWSNTTASAELRPSHLYPDGFQSLAASGDTVVAGSQDGNAAYVFTKPAGGWSGTLHESAILTASGATSPILFGNSVAAFGRTVVVGAEEEFNVNHPRGAVYVFTEPRTGWSGALHQTAELIPSDKTATHLGDSLAASGQVVVAPTCCSTGASYVFLRPAGGWSGTLHEAAKLIASHPRITGPNSRLAATDGSTIVLGEPHATVSGVTSAGAVYLYSKPRHGWSGTLTETATLTKLRPNPSCNENVGDAVAVSGSTVVAGSGDSACIPPGIEGLLPGGAAYVFTEPLSGWARQTHETARLTAPPGAWPNGGFGDSLALSQNTLIIGAFGAEAAYVFEQTRTRH